MLLGPVVVIDGRTAAVLGPHLARAARAARLVDGASWPTAVLEVVAEVDRLGSAYRGRIGTVGIPPTVPVDTMALMSTADVAAALGVSERRVRQLIEHRTLPAHRRGGRRWVVDPVEVRNLIERTQR